MNENPLPSDSSDPQDQEHRGSRWVGGAVLIVLGVIFLAQNMGMELTGNWWAIFIFVPAVGALVNAWQRYRVAGRITNDARGSLFGGVALALVAIAFLLNLDWAIVGPVILIVLGVGALLSGLLGR